MAPAGRSSTWRRAALPVAGGIGFFLALGLLTWGAAAMLSGRKLSPALANPIFEVGRTTSIGSLIERQGPLLFQGLVGTSADKSLVLDYQSAHVGDEWHVYYAHPADGDPSCKVSQVQHTRTFVDCTGRQLQVEQLAPPPGVFVLVRADGSVAIDLRKALAAEAAGTPLTIFGVTTVAGTTTTGTGTATTIVTPTTSG